MDLKTAMGVDGAVTNLDTRPPEDSKVKSSFAVEATVDVKQQELRTVRPYVKAINNIPPALPEQAQLVLHLLFSCFEKQGRVQEGKLDDMLFGFVDAGGFPFELIRDGLTQLQKQGYIRFQSQDNAYLDLSVKNSAFIWVRYEKKLLDLVYE